MKKFFVRLLCAVPFLGMAGCESSSSVNTTAVKNVDLKRYVGTWYEVARFDHRFERGLVGCTAEYSINPDGTIKVVNAGYKNSLKGKYKESVGKARRRAGGGPGELEVTFFMNFYGDYNVMELAEDYRYVLVGSKDEDYLWILSRTPQLEPKDMEYLLNSAKKRGYNVENLIWVEQLDSEW